MSLDLEQERTTELEHLDALRQAMLPKAMAGDAESARILVRVHQARAALLNLARIAEPAPEAEVTELDRIRATLAARRQAVL